MRINTLYTSTLGKISNPRVKIDGHIQCLDLQADYAMVDGAVNLATAATKGFQLWHTWSDLSSIAKGIGVASVAPFMALAFGNYKVYQLSQGCIDRPTEKFEWSQPSTKYATGSSWSGCPSGGRNGGLNAGSPPEAVKVKQDDQGKLPRILIMTSSSYMTPAA